MSEKILNLIVNKTSKTGKSKKLIEEFIKKLEEKNISFICHETKSDGHALLIARDVTSKEGEHFIGIMGGDGTLNEVVNGIKNIKNTTLTLIPMGSGNDFLRGMGVKIKPLDVVDKIESYIKDIKKQVSEVTIGVMENSIEKRRFMISSGMGFDANVCLECNHKSIIKRILNFLNLGQLSYNIIALKQLLFTKNFDLRINVDGVESIYKDTVVAVSMNLPYEGGGFKFCPDASGERKSLSYMVAFGLKPIKILPLLPLAKKGLHINNKKHIKIGKGKNIKMYLSKKENIHTDGEPRPGDRIVSFYLEDEKLKFLM